MRRPLPLLALAALTSACATVPQVSLPPAPAAPPPRAPIEVCLLVAEEQERALALMLDAWTLERFHLAIGSIVVRHPSGIAVIDPAFGSQLAHDLRRTPVWMQAVLLGRANTKTPLADQLEGLGIDPLAVSWALLSHAHWDHAGGLRDLVRARVVLHREELAFVRGLSRERMEHGAMGWHFRLREDRFAPFEFDGPPYEGFDRSHDVFGDGSVVAVPLPGHTPGSTGYFLNTGESRWLYIGDAAWSLEGVKRPAHKSAVARAGADRDVAQTGRTLGLLHAFERARPDVAVLPAHDRAALDALPRCAPGRPPPSRPDAGASAAM